MPVYLAGKDDTVTFTPLGGDELTLAVSFSSCVTVSGGVRIAVLEHVFHFHEDDPEPVRTLEVGQVGRLRVVDGKRGPVHDIPVAAIVTVVRNSPVRSFVRQTLVIVEVPRPEGR